ncbi:hypothetical protein SAMN05444397_10172 [Flavobacterium aquidurense]|uniref:hypothetical protein n=1 Tax=Flavobacterium frigidimaris TaxID=262320 RepID=UPI0008956D85|nr:hypothetical protein [Flavobacterium frigidimaris]SDY21799.1 hypothetical protein SAMN05444397_10172 [Flavobacterium aquidurense]
MKYKLYKNIFLLSSLSFLVISCCYNGLYSKNGSSRRKINDYKHKNAKIDNIDTLAVYKEKINFAINNISKEYVFFEKNDENSYPFVSYLKFYSNNKVGIFSIHKSDTLKLTRAHFNPSKATMGYYFIEGNKMKIKFSIVFQCSHQILREKATINKDSITTLQSGHSGTIYVKRNIPIAYLENWKPDW